jgi:ribosomal protein S18 acetylase RimI-like enzyme
MRVDVFDGTDASKHFDGLSELLVDAVHKGALVGHVLPLDPSAVKRYWRGVASSVAAGERLLICAIDDDQVVGTVQLYLSPEPNAPHRAEIHKLLVHSSRRNQGIGEALMLEVEREARNHKRSLLLLDTAQGGAGERLYRRLGWQEVGVVPHHFVDPWGTPMASVYMMRFIE